VFKVVTSFLMRYEAGRDRRDRRGMRVELPTRRGSRSTRPRSGSRTRAKGDGREAAAMVPGTRT